MSPSLIGFSDPAPVSLYVYRNKRSPAGPYVCQCSGYGRVGGWRLDILMRSCCLPWGYPRPSSATARPPGVAPSPLFSPSQPFIKATGAKEHIDWCSCVHSEREASGLTTHHGLPVGNEGRWPRTPQSFYQTIKFGELLERKNIRSSVPRGPG